jgi:hypothetical protein
MRFTAHNLIRLLRFEEGFRLRDWQKFEALRIACREAGQAKNSNEQRDERCPRNQGVKPVFDRIAERMQELTPVRNPPSLVPTPEWAGLVIALADQPVARREELDHLR